MRIFRLAELFAHKYKMAAGPADLETSVREKISNLWHVVGGAAAPGTRTLASENILRHCATAGTAALKDPHKDKAISGYHFCKELVTLIDYVYAKRDDISLGEMREVLLHLVKSINENKSKDKSGQFANVTELIFQTTHISTKHDIALRNESYNKARTQLSRISSIAIGILKDLQKLEFMTPEKFTYKKVTDIDIDQRLPERFSPQRAMLGEKDIIDFIRQYGNEYGIPSREAWGIIATDDQQLMQKLTTVINALNRGHIPKDAATVKMEIAEFFKKYEEGKSSNAHLFEDSE
jgi:hypothetical protein